MGGKSTLSRFVTLSCLPPTDQTPSLGIASSAASSSAVATTGLPAEAVAAFDPLADLAGDFAALAGAFDGPAGFDGPAAFDGVACLAAVRFGFFGGTLDSLTAFDSDGGGADTPGTALASAAARASDDATARSRVTAFGSCPSSIPLNEV